jgi:hypothetical protein
VSSSSVLVSHTADAVGLGYGTKVLIKAEIEEYFYALT